MLLGDPDHNAVWVRVGEVQISDYELFDQDRNTSKLSMSNQIVDLVQFHTISTPATLD